ncbi:MAG: hypothetical protein L6R30_02470 [Thermoanaerobaculia bacterium]|nr:hypothetical protein [Thermoanaerobaculia bacterium]
MTSTRPARSRRKRNLSPLLLLSALLAAAVITSPAEGSLPRAGLQEANPAALAGAKAVESGRLLAAGLETPFTLITADELEGVLACDPVPEAGGLNLGEDPSLEPPQLTSRACAASFSLHLEPVDFELNPQRGPPLEIPDLHQGWFVADSKTRIGGFRLELEDLIGGERSLTLELHWGYEVGRVGLTEDEPPDPWGLVTAVDPKVGKYDIGSQVNIETGNHAVDFWLLSPVNNAVNVAGGIENSFFNLVGMAYEGRNYVLKSTGASDTDIQFLDTYFAMNPSNAAAAVRGIAFGLGAGFQKLNQLRRSVGESCAVQNALAWYRTNLQPSFDPKMTLSLPALPLRFGKTPLALPPADMDNVIASNYQRYINDAAEAVVKRFNQGKVSIPEGMDWRTVLGQRIDAEARYRMLRFLERENIAEGPGAEVLVNRWLRDPSGSGNYRIPDLMLKRKKLILDGTIGSKTQSSPQIVDFKSFSDGYEVVIVRPQSGPLSRPR